MVKNKYDYNDIVMKQLNSITNWNFSFDELDDDGFWSKYILAKDGDKYLYLEKLIE